VYVILSIYLIFCEPYFPTMKFIFNVVIVVSFIVGISKVFYVMSKNCRTDFPII